MQETPVFSLPFPTPYLKAYRSVWSRDYEFLFLKMVFMKVIKNKVCFKRYQVRFRRWERIKLTTMLRNDW